MKFYCDVTVSSTPSKSRRSNVGFLMGTLKFFFVPCSWQDGKTSLFSRCAYCKITPIVSMSFVFVNPRVSYSPDLLVPRVSSSYGSFRPADLLILQVFSSRGSSYSAGLLTPRVFSSYGYSYPQGLLILRVFSSHESSHSTGLLIPRIFSSNGSSHRRGLLILRVFSSKGSSHSTGLSSHRSSYPRIFSFYWSTYPTDLLFQRVFSSYGYSYLRGLLILRVFSTCGSYLIMQETLWYFSELWSPLKRLNFKRTVTLPLTFSPRFRRFAYLNL